MEKKKKKDMSKDKIKVKRKEKIRRRKKQEKRYEKRVPRQEAEQSCAVPVGPLHLWVEVGVALGVVAGLGALAPRERLGLGQGWWRRLG